PRPAGPRREASGTPLHIGRAARGAACGPPRPDLGRRAQPAQPAPPRQRGGAGTPSAALRSLPTWRRTSPRAPAALPPVRATPPPRGGPFPRRLSDYCLSPPLSAGGVGCKTGVFLVAVGLRPLSDR